MKNLIKENHVAFIAIALSIVCPLGTANAQMNNGLMKSSGTMDKLEMKKSSYVVPRKPEDISPLLYGEKFPKAVLSDRAGNSFDLNKAIFQSPTILVFYRGGWCPYCSRQLSGLQEAQSELKQLGYQLIAVSSDAPDGLVQSAAEEKLSYTLLSDADLALSRQVGIAYKAPEGYREMLLKTTGGKNEDLLLPVPSVFILDETGTILFEYINPDFKQRLDPALLKAVAISIKKDI